MTLTVRPLKLIDFAGYDVIDLQKDQITSTIDCVMDVGVDLHQFKALNSDGDIVLTFGLIGMWENTYFIWTLFGKKWSKRHYKDFRAFLHDYFDIIGAARVQHNIEASSNMGQVLEYCGFKYEGKHIKYIDNKDHLMYAWTKE